MDQNLNTPMPRPSAPAKSTALPIIAGIGLYLFTTGVSYAVFNSLHIAGPSAGPITEVPQVESRLKIDPSEPKDQECPINGQMFTKTERESWETRRPLGVMIENHLEARPQSGLSRADVVYEAVAEGAITRFLAMFYCGAQSQETQVGPVRSARTYYIDWASEYGFPLYAHVGGAHASDGKSDLRVRAIEQLTQYGWSIANDLNQFSIGFPTFWQDRDRIGNNIAIEHTMYSTTEKLWEYAKNKREFTNVDSEGNAWDADFKMWEFEDETKLEDRGAGNTINFDFWTDYEDYHVTWTYDKEGNRYLRNNGGAPHIDMNNKQQLDAKVVVIQSTLEESSVDELHHLYYHTTKGGEVLIFQNGQVIKGTWSKKNRLSRTEFKDSSGKAVKFARGKIWIEIVPKGQKVNY